MITDLEKLLTDEQILLGSTIGNVQGIMRRLISGCEGLKKEEFANYVFFQHDFELLR